MSRNWMLIVAYSDGRTEYLTFPTRLEAHAELERIHRNTDAHARPATMVVTPVDEPTPRRGTLRRYATPVAA